MTAPDGGQPNGGRGTGMVALLVVLAAIIGAAVWWSSSKTPPATEAAPAATGVVATAAPPATGATATTAAAPDTANLPTVDIPFSNTNRTFGDFLEGELQAADRDRQRKVAAAPEGVDANGNGAAFMITRERSIAPRRFRDVTVTGVGVMHEGHSVYFREDAAAVRRSFAAAGVRIDGEGNVPGPEDEPPYCNINPTTTPETQAMGASALSCGV